MCFIFCCRKPYRSKERFLSHVLRSCCIALSLGVHQFTVTFGQFFSTIVWSRLWEWFHFQGDNTYYYQLPDTNYIGSRLRCPHIARLKKRQSKVWWSNKFDHFGSWYLKYPDKRKNLTWLDLGSRLWSCIDRESTVSTSYYEPHIQTSLYLACYTRTIWKEPQVGTGCMIVR